MIPLLALTAGDFNGIGPEIVMKAIRSPRVRRVAVPILFGPRTAFERAAGFSRRSIHLVDLAGIDGTTVRILWRHGRIPLFPIGMLPASAIHPGATEATAGTLAGLSLAAAVSAARLREVDGVVTAPVSKRALHLAGIHQPGQTEIVRDLSGGRHVAMMLVSPTLKVGLVTIHLPLAEVSNVLTKKLLEDRISVIHDALQHDWGIRAPRMAVLGLNPHAGENGDMGTEERSIISPVISRLCKRGMNIHGPFPADAFFARYNPAKWDGVVAMYHDQGLIPLKMTAAGRGVNVSVGLPVIRTSPDHGTAFDIAGKGIADASSMIEAVELAATFARNRARYQRRIR